jgi:hypothetical protein
LIQEDDFNIEDAVSTHKKVFEEMAIPKKIQVIFDREKMIEEVDSKLEFSETNYNL